MGYPTERFPTPVDENLICSICRGVFEYPVVTDCGHTFCFECLNEWIQAPCGEEPEEEEQDDQSQMLNNQCPACRHLLEDSGRFAIIQDDTRSFTVARPVLALRNLIEALPMNCIYASRGCKSVKTVELMETGGHQVTCAYAPAECIGCGTVLNRLDLASHQLVCIKVDLPTEPEEDPQESVLSNQPRNLHHKSDKAIQTDPNDNMQSFCDMSRGRDDEIDNSLDSFRSIQTQAEGYNTHGTLDQLLHDREKKTMEFLNLSLLKLVYALKFELECSQTELKLTKLQSRSFSVNRGHNSRKYV